MRRAAKRPSQRPGLQRARRMAAAVLQHHFGKPARRLSHRAAGLSNSVFQADHPAGQFVVRIAEQAEKLNAYIKEQWAICRVRELGVPTPEVLEVGSDIIGMPYMIVRRVRGEEAIHHPLRLDVLRDMGRYTALINSVPTTGFGRTFEWSANRLSHNASWKAYLDSELALEHRLEVLRKHRMLAPAKLRKLRGLLLAIGRKRKAPTLNHGDMRLKNVIVDEAGKITAIIDWEECCSQIAPYWDVSLALHDLSIDAKQAFLEGYGLSREDIVAIAPSLRALNVINYAPAIERAGSDRAKLDGFRLRLSGALDLYAL
jgi:aminoglycoside phosphotransferase (APT) family kinase protein